MPGTHTSSQSAALSSTGRELRAQIRAGTAAQAKPHLLRCECSGLRAAGTRRGRRGAGATTRPFLVLGSTRLPFRRGSTPAASCPFCFLVRFLSAAPPESLPTGRARVPWADSQESPAQAAQTGACPIDREALARHSTPRTSCMHPLREIK